jgi:hypothetical protein
MVGIDRNPHPASPATAVEADAQAKAGGSLSLPAQADEVEPLRRA